MQNANRYATISEEQSILLRKVTVAWTIFLSINKEKYVAEVPIDGPACPIIKKLEVSNCSANLSRALQIFIS